MSEHPVIVTGANGQVGRRVLRAWRHEAPGFDYVAVARQAGPDWQAWEAGQPPVVPKARAVVGLWGVCFGTLDETRVNLDLARAAQDLAAATGADRVIHLSTQSVYGRHCQNAAEDQTPTPANPYGTAKAEMEEMLRGIHAPKPVILRVANVIGADAISRSLAGDAPVVLDRFADGSGPVRSFIGIADLARIIAALVTCPLDQCPDVMNIASPVDLPMDAILNAAGRAFEWRDAPAGALPSATIATDRLRASGLPQPRATSAEALYRDWQLHAD
ncbi:NAD-dependent epimerase/dehydratase family protein [Donghicola sp. C2-DW-16]|uniref:NAD-dependent epimerase/dehydratase family protein n=1 Tax=Donghicola mangrovi TaxID=2729614 RepID=A0ABX2P903_9RHOB|nr:NAD-dependent epimerase/dehydratase family protein [Donghicola mangrovi]NVO25932.1 NAD-dependent epimerase/dehydratase family protein [Donghicola mangrovi]